MQRIWDKKRIREELEKLDMITGLHGAELPIEFTKAKGYAIKFVPEEGNMRFRFSDATLQDSQYTEKAIIMAIRAIYAKYMVIMQCDKWSHNYWKKCCEIIETLPCHRIYKPINEYYYQNKNASAAFFSIGAVVSHPQYSNGIIEDVEEVFDDYYEKPIDLFFNIYFENGGNKKLRMSEVMENCTLK